MTDVAKNVDNSENKEDNSETSSADTKTSETEVKPVENTATETSVVKEPEKKTEEPKVKSQSKKKKKAKQDEYYEMIEDFYDDLCSNYFSEEDIEEIVDDLEGKIPDSYKLRNGRTIARVMINDIFARYGYTFKDRKLQEFYNKKEWYKKLKNKITTSNILKRQEKVLQRIEKKNEKLRKNYDHLAKFV